ncbi:MAG: cation-transporting P-type ATPase, partial [Phycisphaerales bacterium]
MSSTDTQPSLASPKWHALSIEQVTTELGTEARSGLSASEARQRLERDGPNTITVKDSSPWWVRFLLQFHAPLIYILLAATVVTLFLGEYVDSAVIFAVVLVNAVIGYVQETRAANA